MSPRRCPSSHPRLKGDSSDGESGTRQQAQSKARTITTAGEPAPGGAPCTSSGTRPACAAALRCSAPAEDTRVPPAPQLAQPPTPPPMHPAHLPRGFFISPEPNQPDGFGPGACVGVSNAPLVPPVGPWQQFNELGIVGIEWPRERRGQREGRGGTSKKATTRLLSARSDRSSSSRKRFSPSRRSSRRAGSGAGRPQRGAAQLFGVAGGQPPTNIRQGCSSTLAKLYTLNRHFTH